MNTHTHTHTHTHIGVKVGQARVMWCGVSDQGLG